MAKELPYFKFFIGEWLKGDVTVCSMSTQGLFINLCVYYWGKEGDLTLKSVQHRFNTCSTELETLLDMGIISIENENIVINFLDDQFSDFEILRKKKSRAGKASAKVRGVNNRATPVQHNPNKEEKRREDKDKEKSINIEFDIFWNLYDKKTGDKSKIEKKWIKLSNKNRELIIMHLSEYIKSTPEKQYRKNPETYLNQSGWEDEIITSEQKSQETKGSNLSSDSIPENFGVVSKTAITRQQYLDEKKLTK